MRLNDSAPVWHASLSIRTPDDRMVSSSGVAERAGIALLAGVGNDREWWIWNSGSAVGHLRVGLNAAELATLPVLTATADAGPSGLERPRSAGRGHRDGTAARLRTRRHT